MRPTCHTGLEPALEKQLARATVAIGRILSRFRTEPHYPARHESLLECRIAFSLITRLQNPLEKLTPDVLPGSSHALSKYRSALTELRPHLSRIQAQLILEKGRLLRTQAHAASLDSWIAAHGQTR